MDQNINSKYWDSQPNLSSNGNILFFASNRPGGKGGRDIWYSIRTNDGWSLAKLSLMILHLLFQRTC